MAPRTLEDLVKNHSSVLQNLRIRYYPLIAQGLATGYNLYLAPLPTPNFRFGFSYYHSELKPTDDHFNTLFQRIRNYSSTNLQPVIRGNIMSSSLVLPRNAVYLIKPEWKNPSDMHYYDLQGFPLIPTKEGFQRLVVGESLQYELFIAVESEKELRNLANFFKRYASKDLLNMHGKKVIHNEEPVKNGLAIDDSCWSVPLFVCDSKNGCKPPTLKRDFLAVLDLRFFEQIEDNQFVIQTFVRQRKKNLPVLRYPHFTSKKYVLRQFVEDYLDS